MSSMCQTMPATPSARMYRAHFEVIADDTPQAVTLLQQKLSNFTIDQPRTMTSPLSQTQARYLFPSSEPITRHRSLANSVLRQLDDLRTELRDVKLALKKTRETVEHLQRVVVEQQEAFDKLQRKVRRLERTVRQHRRMIQQQQHTIEQIRLDLDQTRTTLSKICAGEVVINVFRLLGYDPEGPMQRSQYLLLLRKHQDKLLSYVQLFTPDVSAADLDQMLQGLAGSPMNSYIEERNRIAHSLDAREARECAARIPGLARWISVLLSDAKENESVKDLVRLKLEHHASCQFLRVARQEAIVQDVGGREPGSSDALSCQDLIQALKTADAAQMSELRSELKELLKGMFVSEECSDTA